MAATKPVLYTVTTLSHALGVSGSQISQWKAAGLPFTKAGRITMAAAVHWLRNEARRERPKIGAGEATERRAMADAELAELKLARERGDVVPASEVYEAAEDDATRVRVALAGMPSTYAPIVAAKLGCSLRDAFEALREVGDAVASSLAMDEGEEAA